MSDARSKLNEALANAANKRVASPPAAPSKPAPKSPPPAQKAPSPPKTSASKPKPKKKKPPKPKKTGPGASSVMMKSLSKFANNMIDELKTATSEISPAALIHTATDSIQSIKNAVGLNGQSSPQTSEPTENNQTPATEDGQARATSGLSATDTPPAVDISASAPEKAPEPSGPLTSPAKVQRMPSKKKKNPDASASEPAEPSQEDLLNQLTSDTITPEQPAASPAKVVRAPSKKAEDESSADPSTTEDEISDLSPEDTESASGGGAESSAQETDMPHSEDTPPASEAPEPPSAGSAQPSGQAKKPAPKPQSAVISKTEHAVRSFQALQNLLTNPMWAPIITDPEIKPSSLYAPRERFDTNFSDPTFRAGLKAASRLASSFGFDPEKMRFNTSVIEKVKSVDIDPEGKIKLHTENISGVIGEEKVKEIMGIYHNKNFQHLLFSVGTRMGSFVPTIESLARIYLSLRKKEPLTSSARLQMQEEILMRYRKAPYTEEMGKKARNLAMKYFMDYLATYAIKLYKERFKDAPDGQNNAESHHRRHETIKSFCCDMIDEWAKKIALATPAIISMQAKFRDLADQHLEKVLASGSQEN